MSRADLVSKDPTTGKIRPSDLPASAIGAAQAGLPRMGSLLGDPLKPFATVIGFGSGHVVELLDALRAPLMVTFGGASVIPLLTTAPTLASGAVVNTGDYANWPSGLTYTIPPAGTAAFVVSTFGVRINEVEVFYFDQGGGGFDIDITGGTTVSASVDLPAISTDTVQAEIVTVDANTATVTITATAGTVRILGVGVRDTENLGGVRLCPIARTDAGGTVTNLLANPVALAHTQQFLQLIDPHLILIGLEVAGVTALDDLADDMDTVLSTVLDDLTPIPDAVLVTAPPYEDELMANQQPVLRDVAADLNYALFDSFAYLDSYDRLVDLGWEGTWDLPGTDYYTFIAPLLVRDMGLLGSGGGGVTPHYTRLNSSTGTWGSVLIESDDTDSSPWPNRFEWLYKQSTGLGKLVQWVNEYGEGRFTSARSNTVALRVFTKLDDTDPDHNANINVFEIMDDRDNRTLLMGVDWEGTITAPNIGAKVVIIDNGGTVPAGTPEGSLIVEREA